MKKIILSIFVAGVIGFGIFGVGRYYCENKLARIIKEANSCETIECFLVKFIEYAEVRNGICGKVINDSF